MTKPNSTQKALLECAAQSVDGMISADGVARATTTSMVRKGWMLVAPQTSGGDRLLITEAGREALVAAPADGAPAEQTAQAAAPAAKPASKLDALTELLRQPAGATLAQLMAATGWQAHSVRGAIAGALKKRGLSIVSQKSEQGRVYRIQVDG